MNLFLKNKEILPDFPLTGPLARYRKHSTFYWKKLKLIIYDKDSLMLQHKMFQFYMNHPLFTRSIGALTSDEQRHLTTKRMIVEGSQRFYTYEDFLKQPNLQWMYGASLTAFDPNFTLKVYIQYWMFDNLLRILGTERLQKYVKAIQNSDILGCCAITEVSHGSNAKKFRTTATYDPESKSFIINTPDFEAAKCWAGSLGKTCTHAIVYAQLFTSDGDCHGLNAFLVPIRDIKTMLTISGVVVGDLGEKLGLNGIDNGFLMFDHYKISKENLLSRVGDVTDDGSYVTFIEDKNKRLALLLAPLSNGRVYICANAACYLEKAIIIAIRYSAARKQFGPAENEEELPVLEYQAQQYRLLPYLASTYALIIFSRWLLKENGNIFICSIMGEPLLESAIELHAISSACKPYCTWLGATNFDARNNVQVFHSNLLALCYAQCNVYRVFYEFVDSIAVSNEKEVLKDLLILYGSNLMLQNSGLLHQSGYFKGTSATNMYESIVLKYLEKIKVNAVSLIDSIAYPDFFINSCLGNSDGEVYQHIKSTLYNSQETFQRAKWWKDVVYKEKYCRSKL